MFGLSLGHVIILVLVLLLFGARRLPELGSSLGKGLRNFKKGFEGKDLEQGESDRQRVSENREDDPRDGRA